MADRNRYRYGSRVEMILNEGIVLGFEEDVTLLVGQERALRVRETRKPTGGNRSLRRYEVSLEAFQRASEAEHLGERLALALLWSAISIKYSARLVYSGEMPYRVYDRALGGGLQMYADGYVARVTTPTVLAEVLEDFLNTDIAMVPELQTSMELFTAARMETSDRAKFVGLVSAVEPLAKQQKYKGVVKDLTKVFQQQLDEAEGIDDTVRESLRGRIADLRRESVRLAIRRLFDQHMPNNAPAWEAIDEAYGARSKMLHEGETYEDLAHRSSVIEDVLRLLYSRILGKALISRPGLAPGVA